MLDLSQNLIIAIVVGPGIAAAIGLATWSVRRTFHRQDRDIDNQDRKIAKQDRELEKMALEQKEFDKKLLGVLLNQKGYDEKLRAGFKQISSDMDSVKTSISGLETELREHSAKMDKEIALLRERIGRNGAG